MQEIASPIELDEESIIEYFIDGIPDSRVNKLVLYEASTLFQLKDKLRVYEKVHPIGKTSSYSPSSCQVHKTGSKVNTSVKDLFICNSPSHFAKNCTERKQIKCYKCAQFGHKANECKTNFKKENEF